MREAVAKGVQLLDRIVDLAAGPGSEDLTQNRSPDRRFALGASERAPEPKREVGNHVTVGAGSPTGNLDSGPGFLVRPSLLDPGGIEASLDCPERIGW